MATQLTIQAYGARGESYSLVAPDANGNEIHGNAPGVVLVARNAGAGDLRVRFSSAEYCSHGRNTHYLDVTIPNDSARWPIALGVNERVRMRLGSIVRISYPDGVTSLTVAAAKMDDHFGRGADPQKGGESCKPCSFKDKKIGKRVGRFRRENRAI